MFSAVESASNGQNTRGSSHANAKSFDDLFDMWHTSEARQNGLSFDEFVTDFIRGTGAFEEL